MLTALDLENQIRPYLPNFMHPEKTKSGFGKISDEVIEYQLRNNIPATCFRELDWDGTIITAPFCSYFLYSTPNDLEFMKENKDRTLKSFVDFANEKIEKEGYLLCEQTFDEDICEIFLPIDVKHFEEMALDFDWVELLYSADYVTSYYLDEEETTLCWEKCFDLFLKRGDSLDFFRTESFMFSLKKTFLSDPRK